MPIHAVSTNIPEEIAVKWRDLCKAKNKTSYQLLKELISTAVNGGNGSTRENLTKRWI